MDMDMDIDISQPQPPPNRPSFHFGPPLGFEIFDLEKPQVMVVGNRNSGKTALVEALIGFQFSSRGETRRPIVFHTKKDPNYEDPYCYVASDSDPDVAVMMSPEEIRAYIEAENMRLEHEPCQFSAKEIVIWVKYKYCLNLTIMDTPGLTAGQAFQGQVLSVKSFLLAKMQHKEITILLLEDRSDKIYAITRRVVMQVDPQLSRTVVVSTKLDQTIPKFLHSSDVESFLRPALSTFDGSTFYTFVPYGRVGPGPEFFYRSNNEFIKAITTWEKVNVASLEEKLGRLLSNEERKRIGISSLRLFLEDLHRKRHMNVVQLIVQLLEMEDHSTARKQNDLNLKFSNLDEVKLQERERIFYDSLLTKLTLLMKGTGIVPADIFGETLQDERVTGGKFTAEDLQFPQQLVPDGEMRLYGSNQYRRALTEFCLVVRATKCPSITGQEIVNACGVEVIHDGTHYLSTACVIAVAKARDTFEALLPLLGARLLHILKRLVPVSVYLLQIDGKCQSFHEINVRRVTSAVYNFVLSTETTCRDRCTEDLMSITCYVTLCLHNKNWAGLQEILDSCAGSKLSVTPSNTIASVFQELSHGLFMNNNKNDVNLGAYVKNSHMGSGVDSSFPIQTAKIELVDRLVQQIFHGIREHFLTSAESLYNILLTSVVDEVQTLLLKDPQSMSENDLRKRKRELEDVQNGKKMATETRIYA